MKLVIISGRSGSGKSTALNVLEDAGYYSIDNLPHGIAGAHCEWPAAAAQSLWRSLRWFAALTVPAVFIIFVFEATKLRPMRLLQLLRLSVTTSIHVWG